MQIQENVDLSHYTSFRTGGQAEKLVLCESPDEIVEAIKSNKSEKNWTLGYGTNVLISDEGLPGLTLMCRGGQFYLEEDLIISEASTWWDDLVVTAIESGLWGAEFMSGIPSSVGAAITGNIAAYGQQVSDILEWIEVFDKQTKEIKKLEKSDIQFSYRASSLQNQPEIIILKAAFKLSFDPTAELQYASALKVAETIDIEPSSLENRRQIIMETRRQAGSLYDPNDADRERTDGSFFKNPTVELEQAKEIAKFDETGKSFELIMQQNKIHGGSSTRISAALVLLAAGFKRGQTWGHVRLHPQHVLKIENTGGAKSLDIYNVANEIIKSVDAKLSIKLEPEVKFLGKF
jgi:UDP-N-acetylmuramate dehydrogenase